MSFTVRDKQEPAERSVELQELDLGHVILGKAPGPFPQRNRLLSFSISTIHMDPPPPEKKEGYFQLESV